MATPTKNERTKQAWRDSLQTKSVMPAVNANTNNTCWIMYGYFAEKLRVGIRLRPLAKQHCLCTLSGIQVTEG